MNNLLQAGFLYSERNRPTGCFSGAYSCEAINSMGSCFAGSAGCGQPGQDAIVVRIEQFYNHVPLFIFDIGGRKPATTSVRRDFLRCVQIFIFLKKRKSVQKLCLDFLVSHHHPYTFCTDLRLKKMKIWSRLRKSRQTEIVEGFQLRTEKKGKHGHNHNSTLAVQTRRNEIIILLIFLD